MMKKPETNYKIHLNCPDHNEFVDKCTVHVKDDELQREVMWDNTHCSSMPAVTKKPGEALIGGIMKGD